MTGTAQDPWAQWLLETRHGGDAAFRSTVQAQVATVVTKLLDALALRPHMHLLDIGSGEGGVAWQAIQAVGPTLRVTLSDISGELLRHAEQAARQQALHAQCSFLQCSAERLEGVDDASIDAISCRAALAYVPDKAAALAEFARVLRPGGRLSMAEPVLQDDAFETAAMRAVLERSGEGAASPLALLYRCRAAQFPDTEQAIRSTPITAYSERDLVRLALNAGFADIHMEFHVDMFPSIYPSWEVYLASSPHPLAPRLGTVLAERFTPEERARFEAFMRPRIENPRSLTTSRVAYLSACKPGS